MVLTVAGYPGSVAILAASGKENMSGIMFFEPHPLYNTNGVESHRVTQASERGRLQEV